MQVTDPFGQLFFPLAGVALWILLTWTWGRTVRAGKPFTPGMKKLLVFGSLFLLGLLYLLAWNSQLALAVGFPGRLVWIPLSVVWGIVLAFFAWRKYRRERASSGTSAKLDSPIFVESLARAGLLVALIGAALEWVFVVEKEGHLWLALLWTAACVAMIFLAKRDRRGAVLAALRLLVLLAVLGAISRPSLRAAAAVVVLGVVLLLTQKLWAAATGPAE
jgi:hypothetical protein